MRRFASGSLGMRGALLRRALRGTQRAMSRKADPSSHRSPKRRSAPVVSAAVEARSPRKIPVAQQVPHDTDFGLAMALGPSLRRRRPDA